MNDSLSHLLEKLCKGTSLSLEQSYLQFESIAQEKYNEIEIAALLTALKAKGENINEIVGAVLAMRNAAKSFPKNNLKAEHTVVDCVGTGGDGFHTFNISTTVAFVLACCGVMVAKHGNHAVSSKCGSADLLKQMGANLAIHPEHALTILEKIGVCFLYAPLYHPGAHFSKNVRKTLRVKTIFNLLGPLLNPLQPDYQLMGVYDPKLCLPLAEVLNKLGLKRAIVMNGSGLDEIAIHGSTQGSLLYDGEILDFFLIPEEVGLKRYSLDEIKGSDIEHNAKEFQNLLMGNGLEAYQAAIAINAGTLLWLIGQTTSITQGVLKIKNLLNTSLPYQRFKAFVELSHAS